MRHTSLLFFWALSLCPAARLLAQDPDIEANERAVMEEVFRTSDQPGETPTSRRQRDGHTKRVSVPKGAFRIGCVCMDDTHSDTRSTGACSGHGGVRFWVYRTPEGDTVQILTGRHERHPHALSATEMSELSQKRADRTQNLRTVAQPPAPMQYMAPTPPPQVVVMPDTRDRLDWGDAAALSVTGASIFFVARMLLRWAGNNPTLVRYALRHLLRPRKRPAARPNGQTARKKRVP